MKLKRNSLIKIWIAFTVILTLLCISAVFSLITHVRALEVRECSVETEMLGLPEINIIEVEKEIIVEKPVNVYKFPFGVKEKGTYPLKAVCNDCIPQKEYSQLWGVEDITVFASESVMPEGTLIWIEGVGIRQVQTVYSDFDGIYVFFDSHSDVESFEEKDVLVFEIVE